MPLQKYIDRLERLHLLIKRKSTGTVDELADKIGLSRRQTLEYISDMKELGAPIQFCKYRNTYFYTRNVNLSVGFSELSDAEAAGLMGGFVPAPLLPSNEANFFSKLLQKNS